MTVPDPASPQRVEQLHRDIDSGTTGERVAAFDPAASPLGSDDEAAGMPPSQARIVLSRDQERTHGFHAQDKEPSSNLATWFWIIAALILMTIAILSFIRTN